MTTPAVQQAAPKPQPVVQPSRMRLANVVKGKIKRPVRITLYGPEGVGKSTFGAGAPKPIFLGAEDGTAQLDVARFPSPERFEDVLEALLVLSRETHDYDSLVVDSLDWIEPLIWQYICKRDGEKNIESYGYGKGYVTAIDEWRRFFAGLEYLQRAKPMHVILLAHSWIKPFKNPEGEDFDRYELKLDKKAAGLAKEWSEAVLFTTWETYAKKDEKTKKVKGVSTGARIVYTERTAAYDAKNRFSLPDELPLSWADFYAAVETGAVAPVADLQSEIARKAALLGGDLEKMIAETVAKAGNNAESLARINNKVNAKIAERGL